ncbi:MAG TPA: hypothetical protein VM680_02525 [Verrucomicrobiae bacterium]|nr:hypothetical protein [Verrucomicrobiae bacterium]
MATLPLLRFAAFTLAFAHSLFAADEQWSREFFPATATTSSAVINAMLTTPDGKLIYAGKYLPTEDATFYGVVVVQTGDIRTAIASYGGDVFALAYDGQNLYAGGEFTTLSGYAVTNLARWDGRKWNQVGGGVSGGPVRALAIKEGVLYVGGGFTKAGNLPVTGLARWDGANWTSLGNVTPSTQFPAVRAIQFIGDSLFISGRFENVGGITATNVAEYTQGAWRALGLGVASNPFGVSSLAANSKGELFAGGDFYQAGNVSVKYVAKWNGSEWSALKNGLSRESAGGVKALLCVGNDLYAAGNFRYVDGVMSDGGGYGVARWDGENWSDLGVPFYEGATAIAADASNVYVAGPTRNPMYPREMYDQSGIARFDGTHWHIPGGVQTTVVAGDIVDGKLRLVSTENLFNDQQNIADWDGANWKLIGKINGRLTRQLLHRDGTTYIIGEFSAVNGVPANQIAAYDGVNWRSLAQGLSYPDRIDFLGTNLVATDRNGIHMLKDNAWQNLPAPPLARQIGVISGDGESLYVAATSFEQDPLGRSEIVRWDGQQWTTLGFQGNGSISVIRPVGDRLYVAGSFSEAGGAPAKMLAVLDAGVWRELGGGVVASNLPYDFIRAIEPDGEGGVFVAGYFYQLGNTPANSICHWDGEEWRTMGRSILGGEVHTLRREGRDLYAFGLFYTAGGHPSSSIAKWHMADLELIARGVAADGTFNFEARGLLNSRFVLQQSADLQAWQSVSTNTLTARKLPLTINSPLANGHFFRLIAN